MASLARQARRWLPGLIISLIAIVVLVNFADWDEVYAAFTGMRWTYLLGASGFYLASILSRTFAWRVLLQRKASLPRVFFVLNEGYLLNNLFPFRLGELGRAILMSGSAKVSTFHVLSTIVIERAFDLAIAAVFLLSTLPLVFGMPWARPVAITTLVVVLLLLLGLYLAARYRDAWQTRFEKAFARYDTIKRLLLSRMDALMDGFGALTQPGQFILSLAGMAGNWLLSSMFYYILLLAIAPQTEYWWAIFVLGVAAMGVAVPAAPGSLGVYEASIVGALALLAVPQSPALAMAITAHGLHILITGVAGLVGLYQEGETLGSLYNRLASFRLRQA
jgi:glycosyltransferase 2 family protein